MLILALSDLGRVSTAALCAEGRVIAAVEEEKLSRVTAQDGLPRLAIQYCLREGGVSASDLDAVALAGRPRQAWVREERLRFGLAGPGSAPPAWTAAPFLGRLRQQQELRRLFPATVPFHSFEHHLCHAASAYYASGFDSALVLTLDGAGDMWSGLVAAGEGDALSPRQTMPFPNSLGWLYSTVTRMLGYRSAADEHKTQWLSTAGMPGLEPAFKSMFRQDPRGLPLLRKRFVRAAAGEGAPIPKELFTLLEFVEGKPRNPEHAAAVARGVQTFLEDTVVDLAERYRRETRARHLCLAGGVFLNVLLVRAIETRCGFDQVFVQPAAGNEGTSLGAGWLLERRKNAKASRGELPHLFLGPTFEQEEVKAILDNCKLEYNYAPTEPRLLSDTARLLAQQKIVAWFQGRMEFGFRALGNRSILASPYAPYVQENLNKYLKGRQAFHPFVLSVPAERAPDYFDATSNCRFAASVADLRAGAPGLDAFAFAGRRVRLHLVEQSVNPRFHALLEEFGRTAPAPVLVNTSLNLFGEPLVCDPRAAVRTFYCSGIDAMVLDRFILEK